MRLKTFIMSYGVEKLAKKLNITRVSVHQWKKGQVLPRGFQMQAIKKLSKGKVTYANIIDYHYSRANTNRCTR